MCAKRLQKGLGLNADTVRADTVHWCFLNIENLLNEEEGKVKTKQTSPNRVRAKSKSEKNSLGENLWEFRDETRKQADDWQRQMGAHRLKYTTGHRWLWPGRGRQLLWRGRKKGRKCKAGQKHTRTGLHNETGNARLCTCTEKVRMDISVE